jgi:hypothetical protein
MVMPESVRYRCATDATAQNEHFTIAPKSLRSRCGMAAHLLCYRCARVSQSLGNCYEIAALNVNAVESQLHYKPCLLRFIRSDSVARDCKAFTQQLQCVLTALARRLRFDSKVICTNLVAIARCFRNSSEEIANSLRRDCALIPQ